MVLELHIWGPAHGLPSFDASCLATIAYLRESLLDSSSWKIIPSNNPSITPFRELPALHDGEIWISGFGNIVRYISRTSHGQYNLDKDLSATQNADRIALTSFIESRGQPLLDLSLWVSSDNYNHSTRTILAESLSWPASWSIPNKLREKAKRRSEHLGLSGLDVDAAQEELRRSEGNNLTAQIPPSLRKPKQTVSGILGRNVQKNRFRLEAITAEFLDVVDQKLKGRKWLVSDVACSVDCLLLGFLALMQADTKPALPHPWIRDVLAKKYPNLDEWTTRNAVDWFGRPSTVSAKSSIPLDSPLPWQASTERSWSDLGIDLLDAVVETFPVVGAAYTPRYIPSSQHAKGDLQEKEDESDIQQQYRMKQLGLIRMRDTQIYFRQIIMSSLCLAGFTAILAWNGVFTFSLRRPRWRRSSSRRFGEAGSFLGLG